MQNNNKKLIIIIAIIFGFIIVLGITLYLLLRNDASQSIEDTPFTWIEETDPSGLNITTPSDNRTYAEVDGKLQKIGFEYLLKRGVSSKNYNTIVEELEKYFEINYPDCPRISFLKDSYGYGEQGTYHFTTVAKDVGDFLTTIATNPDTFEISISIAKID